MVEPYYQDKWVTQHCGDCLSILPQLDSESIDLLVTDPPYGIGFMGKDWDRALPDKQIWAECLRVLKAGSFAFVMSIPRADCLSRMIISLEDAGFWVNFTPIFWAYASGFPKATNISKMVDKRGGTYTDCQRFSRYLKAKRKAMGISLKRMNEMFGYVAGCTWWESLNPNNFRFPNNEDYLKLKKLLQLDGRFDYLQGVVGDKIGEKTRGNAGFSKEQVPRPWKEHIGEEYDITSPATPQAKALDGSYGGFQPKPAVEVIIVAMKPLSEKTFVDQALKNRKGIAWLGDGRIPYESDEKVVPFAYKKKPDGYGFEDREDQPRIINPSGRFPANLLVSDDVLNDGVSHSGGSFPEERGETAFFGLNKAHSHRVGKMGDSGSFSRYFDLDKWWAKTFPFLIVPKASKREKNKGLGDIEPQQVTDGRNIPPDYPSQRGQTQRHNPHPTVKPIKLMSYLITLGSRVGDTVVDPFSGSGTTPVACQLLNRYCTAIEIEEKYCEISVNRCRQMVMELM